jgi:hypothetical protein
MKTCRSAVSYQPSAISRQPSAVSHRPSAISYQPSALGGRQLSALGYQPSALGAAIGRQPSAISDRNSYRPSTIRESHRQPQCSHRPVHESQNLRHCITRTPQFSRLQFLHATCSFEFCVLSFSIREEYRLASYAGVIQGLAALITRIDEDLAAEGRPRQASKTKTLTADAADRR